MAFTCWFVSLRWLECVDLASFSKAAQSFISDTFLPNLCILCFFAPSSTAKHPFFSFFKFSLRVRCRQTNFRTAGSQRKMGSIFFQWSEDSNPGRLGGKRECYVCAMPSPLPFIFLLRKISSAAPPWGTWSRTHHWGIERKKPSTRRLAFY